MADLPTYTRIPNDIIEAMPKLGNAELRVLLAIARKTYGWQKECDVISVSQLAKMTGLTSRNTQNAVVTLLEKGLITREDVLRAAGRQPETGASSDRRQLEHRSSTVRFLVSVKLGGCPALGGA